MRYSLDGSHKRAVTSTAAIFAQATRSWPIKTPREVDAVGAAGAALVVAPNADPAVIERAVTVGLAVLPGVATMTEAFQALRAGASGLKLFPGEAMPPEVVRAWRAVLPKDD